MLARVGLVTVAMTTALGVAPIAGADQDDAILCNYTMTDPAIVQVNGTAMVTASLHPATCTGPANPTFAQVCLSRPGIAGNCRELAGYSSPQVFLSPYVAGETYTATGRGCADIVNPPQRVCTTVGPRSVTL